MTEIKKQYISYSNPYLNLIFKVYGVQNQLSISFGEALCAMILKVINSPYTYT